MIHTMEVIFPVDAMDVQFVTRNSGLEYTRINDYLHPKFTAVTFSIYNNAFNGKWYLSMHIDAIKLLGKANITEEDYPQLESEIKIILFNLFGHAQYFKDHILKRIDYRYDAVVANKHHRVLLLHIYKKLKESYKFQKRYLGKIDSRGNFEKYETTIYHSSNSIKVMVYDKEAERNAKKEKVEPYEKNILRFEVAVCNKHLLYKNVF